MINTAAAAPPRGRQLQIATIKTRTMSDAAAIIDIGREGEQNLPGAVDVIDAPASIPRAVLVLSVDQILDGVADGSRLRIEPNVTEQLECACGKVTACWIENRIVIGKRHVFQPWGGDILIKRSPTAI